MMKRRIASAALADIGETTRQVNQKMGAAKSKTIADVFATAAEKVCNTCSKKPVCWGGQYHLVMDGFNNLTETLRKTGRVVAADFSGYMGENCDYKWELANEICTGYERFCGRQEARTQSQALRGVVTDQFDGMSGMLDSLAQELTGIEQVEFPVGDRISALLERENLSPISVSAYTDQSGRMTVEAAIPAYTWAYWSAGTLLARPMRSRAGISNSLAVGAPLVMAERHSLS